MATTPIKKQKWKKVTAPKTWRPQHVGETIEGFYGGQSKRNGSFGEYTIALVRIVWQGMKDIGCDATTGEVRTMKCFDVYIAPAAKVQTPEQIAAMLEATDQTFKARVA